VAAGAGEDAEAGAAAEAAPPLPPPPGRPRVAATVHPVKSFPLNNGFHAPGDCAEIAWNEAATVNAAAHEAIT
jgi:hypothetical protein